MSATGSPSPPGDEESSGAMDWWMPGANTAQRVGVFVAVIMAFVICIAAMLCVVRRWRRQNIRTEEIIGPTAIKGLFSPVFASLRGGHPDKDATSLGAGSANGHTVQGGVRVEDAQWPEWVNGSRDEVAMQLLQRMSTRQRESKATTPAQTPRGPAFPTLTAASSGAYGGVPVPGPGQGQGQGQPQGAEGQGAMQEGAEGEDSGREGEGAEGDIEMARMGSGAAGQSMGADGEEGNGSSRTPSPAPASVTAMVTPVTHVPMSVAMAALYRSQPEVEARLRAVLSEVLGSTPASSTCTAASDAPLLPQQQWRSTHSPMSSTHTPGTTEGGTEKVMGYTGGFPSSSAIPSPLSVTSASPLAGPYATGAGAGAQGMSRVWHVSSARSILTGTADPPLTRLVYTTTRHSPRQGPQRVRAEETNGTPGPSASPATAPAAAAAAPAAPTPPASDHAPAPPPLPLAPSPSPLVAAAQGRLNSPPGLVRNSSSLPRPPPRPVSSATATTAGLPPTSLPSSQVSLDGPPIRSPSATQEQLGRSSSSAGWQANTAVVAAAAVTAAVAAAGPDAPATPPQAAGPARAAVLPTPDAAASGHDQRGLGEAEWVGPTMAIVVPASGQPGSGVTAPPGPWHADGSSTQHPEGSSARFMAGSSAGGPQQQAAASGSVPPPSHMEYKKAADPGLAPSFAPNSVLGASGQDAALDQPGTSAPVSMNGVGVHAGAAARSFAAPHQASLHSLTTKSNVISAQLASGAQSPHPPPAPLPHSHSAHHPHVHLPAHTAHISHSAGGALSDGTHLFAGTAAGGADAAPAAVSTGSTSHAVLPPSAYTAASNTAASNTAASNTAASITAASNAAATPVTAGIAGSALTSQKRPPVPASNYNSMRSLSRGNSKRSAGAPLSSLFDVAEDGNGAPVSQLSQPPTGASSQLPVVHGPSPQQPSLAGWELSQPGPSQPQHVSQPPQFERNSITASSVPSSVTHQVPASSTRPSYADAGAAQQLPQAQGQLQRPPSFAGRQQQGQGAAGSTGPQPSAFANSRAPAYSGSSTASSSTGWPHSQTGQSPSHPYLPLAAGPWPGGGSTNGEVASGQPQHASRGPSMAAAASTMSSDLTVEGGAGWGVYDTRASERSLGVYSSSEMAASGRLATGSARPSGLIAELAAGDLPAAGSDRTSGADAANGRVAGSVGAVGAISAAAYELLGNGRAHALAATSAAEQATAAAVAASAAAVAAAAEDNVLQRLSPLKAPQPRTSPLSHLNQPFDHSSPVRMMVNPMTGTEAFSPTFGIPAPNGAASAYPSKPFTSAFATQFSTGAAAAAGGHRNQEGEGVRLPAGAATPKASASSALEPSPFGSSAWGSVGKQHSNGASPMAATAATAAAVTTGWDGLSATHAAGQPWRQEPSLAPPSGQPWLPLDSAGTSAGSGFQRSGLAAAWSNGRQYGPQGSSSGGGGQRAVYNDNVADAHSLGQTNDSHSYKPPAAAVTPKVSQPSQPVAAYNNMAGLMMPNPLYGTRSESAGGAVLPARTEVSTGGADSELL